MLNRKWCWAACGLAAALLLLAACVPVATPFPSPLPSPPAAEASPTPTPTVAAGPLVTTLTLWLPAEFNPYGDGPGAALLAQQLDSFNQAHPELQVAAIVKKARGRGGLLDFLRTASAAAPSVMPDLVILEMEDLRVAAQAGLLQPLDGFLPDSLVADRYPFAVSLGRVDERTMGIVIAADMTHMAYDPALLSSPPVSWTGALSMGMPLLFPAGGQDGSVNDATLVQYAAAGGRWLDEAGNPLLEAGPLEAVLSFYVRAAEAGVISPTLLLSLADDDACWEQFRQGGAAMTAVSSRRFWAASERSALPAPFPTPDGRLVALAQGRWALALVTADAERQQQAMLLAEWLLVSGQYGLWTQSMAYLPTSQSGLMEWEVSAQERAVLDAMLQAAQPMPPAAVRSAVGPPLQAALEAVLTGQRSPAEAAAEAARAVRP